MAFSSIPLKIQASVILNDLVDFLLTFSLSNLCHKRAMAQKTPFQTFLRSDSALLSTIKYLLLEESQLQPLYTVGSLLFWDAEAN